MVGPLLRMFAASSLALACLALPASAQDTVRVRGTVERIEGPVYIVKTRDGSEVKLVTVEDKPLFVAIVPADPTNMPGLMSLILAGMIATNSGLSVTVSLTSDPSRVLTTKTGPSMRSTVPRTRTVSSAEA